MNKKLFFLLILLFSINAPSQTARKFEIQGHRGARGLAPENTIPSFLKALEFGMDVIELDVVVSRDNKIVVSHEPWFSSAITLDQNNRQIPADKQLQFNLFKMDYAEIKLYDVGSLGNMRFPEQQKMKAHKPLLSEVFSETQRYLQARKLPAVRYNIETKLKPEGDNLYHPAPNVFAKLLYDEILRNKMQQFSMIQSFDERALQEFKKFPIKLPLGLLVENKEGIKKNIERLGFQPDIYSPHYSLIDQETIDYCRKYKIKIVPWTVNEISDMENLKKFDLDGVITDYPDRAIKVFRR